MPIEGLKERFKRFAIDVAILTTKIPKNQINSIYSNQLIRSSSSSGANYRARCRGKSHADFINKLKIVEEELDESIYFLELLLFFNSSCKEKITQIIKEGSELLAIIVTSIKTSKNKYNNQ